MSKRVHKTEQEIVIGKRLRQFREARGLTQRELADKLPGNTNQSMIADLENAEYRLHGQMIIDLCKILEISSDDLLGISEGTDLIENPELARRLPAINQLPEADIHKINQILDIFIKDSK